MKLHPEDPRLTAQVLGELSVEDAAAVELAAAADPALEAELAETRAIQRFLTDLPAPPSGQLLPGQRAAILTTARRADRTARIVRFQRWLIPAAAAAVLALATVLLLRMPGDKPQLVVRETPAVPPPAAPAAPAVTPAIAPPPAISPIVRQGPLATSDFPVLDLPVHPASGNLKTVSNSIRGEGKFPPRDAVRTEELINAFPLRLTGTTAIARSSGNAWHPDNRGSGASAHAATLATETIACPWKPSATLLLISLRGNPRQACEVKLAYHADPANVLHYRILGFAPAASTGGVLPTTLAANTTTTLAIEIECSSPRGGLGTLVWATDGEKAPAISLIHRRDAEPSDDARFGALVCTYAQWLAGEQTGAIDADVVSGLAREIASAELPAERADFLNLIDRTLNL